MDDMTTVQEVKPAKNVVNDYQNMRLFQFIALAVSHKLINIGAKALLHYKYIIKMIL